MKYAFEEGQRVYCTDNGKYGEITTIVPGNNIGWYYVTFDDGENDRFTKESLQIAWQGDWQTPATTDNCS